MGRKQREPDLSTYSGRVAARLRAFREEEGMAVDEMVDRLRRRGVEVSAPSIYHYENGTRVIPPDLYPIFAAIFDKSVRGFLPSE